MVVRDYCGCCVREVSYLLSRDETNVVQSYFLAEGEFGEDGLAIFFGAHESESTYLLKRAHLLVQLRAHLPKVANQL